MSEELHELLKRFEKLLIASMARTLTKDEIDIALETRKEIDLRLKREEKQSEAIKQVKAFCNIFKGQSIDPDSILNIFKEWLDE